MNSNIQVIHTSKGTVYMRRRHHCQAAEYLTSIRPDTSGVNNTNAKINDEIATAIFKAPWRYRIIAAKYGVSRTTVGKIKRKQRWKHIHKD